MQAISRGFPIIFDDPADALLTWERDAMHMPFALAPLAADYVLAVGKGFNDWPVRYSNSGFGDFPRRTFYRVWNGYAYMASDPGVPESELDDLAAREVALGRARAAATATYWSASLLPELHALYASIDRALAGPAGPSAAAEWDSAWMAFERTQAIHFDVVLGPNQAMDDLARSYVAAMPHAFLGDADRLIHGRRHELFELELGVEELAAMVAGAPELARAIREGVTSVDMLSGLPGGRAFAVALSSFLTQHGHMGQSADDLALASWAEEPANLIRELRKRIDHPLEPVDRHRQRQAEEADALAAEVRSVLVDRPIDLESFEARLALARNIGSMTETHNYWIDRMAQARMRSLALRAGRRLVDGGVIAAPADVLFLRRNEVGALLGIPRDRRSLVRGRRAELATQRSTVAPSSVGGPPRLSDPVGPADQHQGGDSPEEPAPGAGSSGDGMVLQGTGSSAGIVRGPARVVLTSDEFDRIQPGDIIVCPSSNPSWVTVFRIAGGLVTDTGGMLSHAAVVAREFGLPAVTAVAGATGRISDGQLVEIDGTRGTVRLLK
ncbi:MAG: PEP-utilizing enzyme [Candidatus Limnocylindrales bacterium]